MSFDIDQKTFNLPSDSSAFARAIKLVSLSSKRIIKAFLAAAHESRRRQAQQIIQQYRHLLDPAAGQESSFTSGPITHRLEQAELRLVVPPTKPKIETDLAAMPLRSKAAHVSL